MLQLGHGDLPVETILQDRKPKRTASLQLGHGDLPVETPPFSLHFGTIIVASIGPRGFTRGNLIALSFTFASPKCFNWATGIYPWKRVSSLLRPGRRLRFNWATGIYPWKPEEAMEEAEKLVKLQLGHGDLPVETRRKRRYTKWKLPGFNWATGIYPWKPQIYKRKRKYYSQLQLGHGDLPVETPLGVFEETT